MEFQKLIKERYSVRSYKTDKVEEEKLRAVLSAGLLAPTACNKHPERIFAVTDKAALSRLAEVRPIFGAPCALVVCCDPECEWKNKRMSGRGSGETDAAIVATHMMLAACDVGLGSCMIGAFNAEDVKRALGIDGRLEVYSILAIGYAAEDSLPSEMHRERPTVDETVKFI